MAEENEGGEGADVVKCNRMVSCETETARRSASGPSGVHPWDAAERDVFLNDLDLSRKWLAMFPECPNLDGKRVVEIGCGYGALSVVSAEHGARTVLGVEADGVRADTARRVVGKECPSLKGRVDFIDYPALGDPGFDEKFDIVLSQNSFEHYTDPEEVFDRMVKLLIPGGSIYAGFGPLWRSPYGSHLKEVCPIPWIHLWSGSYLFRAHNRARPHDPRTDWESFGLNRVSYGRYREVFNRRVDCEVVHFLSNRSIWKNRRLAYWLIEPFRSLPFLGEYLTVSLFIVVRKLY